MQRPDHARDRHEQRRQRARPGQPGQRHDRPGAAARVRNVGGGRPGEVDRATHGNPGKFAFCFAEDEDGSPWDAAGASSAAFAPGVDAVTLFAGEGPRCVVDQLSRDAGVARRARSPRACAPCTTRSCRSAFDAMLVVGPEHARVFARGRLGPRAAARRAARRGCSCRAPSSCAAPAASPRACPSAFARRARCRSSGPAGS